MTIPIIPLVLLALGTLPLVAQQRAVPQVPQPRRASATPRVTRPAQNSEAARIEENITIQLYGSMSNGQKIDLALTGIGPIFRSDQIFGETSDTATCSYSVQPVGERYKIEYSVGMRVKVATPSRGPGNKTITNFQYQDVMVTGTILCMPGVPTVISKSGDDSLTLLIAQADSDPATPEKPE